MLELWQSFLELIPNVVYTRKELLKCIIQTLQMVGWTTLYSAGFGVIFGVTLVVTQKDGILECKPVYQILDKLINVFRSIPFVILVALLIKMTRMISGTSIGTKGMIFPMIVTAVREQTGGDDLPAYIIAVVIVVFINCVITPISILSVKKRVNTIQSQENITIKDIFACLKIKEVLFCCAVLASYTPPSFSIRNML